jgi:hypothetical protein
VGNDDRRDRVSVPDVYFLSRRFSNRASGSPMKLRLAILGLLLALWAGPAFAQSCAMCYSTARALNKEGQNAITRGVVVLLIPPVGFMTIGVGLALRYGKKRDEEAE